MSVNKFKKFKLMLFLIFLVFASMIYFYLLYVIKLQPALDTKEVSVEDVLVSQIKIEDRGFYGNKNAAITFVLFSSFECDSCDNYYNEVYPVLKEEYIQPGKIRYYHKFFLSEEDINLKTEQNNIASNNYCLQKTNKDYWEKYPSINYSNIEQGSKIQACLENSKEILRDAFEIELYGISAQPTMFVGIEGKENTIITGKPTLPRLRRVIKEKEILLGIE